MKRDINWEELEPRELALKEDVGLEGLRFEGDDASSLEVRDISLDRVLLRKVDFGEAEVSGVKLLDVRFENCNLANGLWEGVYMVRGEFHGTRLTGLRMPEAIWKGAFFKGCRADLTWFGFGKFRDVVFENCVFREGNFQGTSFRNVLFKDCDLSKAEFSQASFENVDLRGSDINGMRIGRDSVKGLKVDTGQAIYFAGLLGLDIED